MTKVNTNPDKIVWPTDTWGFTRDLRKAVTQTAARLKGDPDKKLLLDETIKVALEFLEANFKSSAHERAKAVQASIAKDKKAAVISKAAQDKNKKNQGKQVPADDAEKELFSLDDE